MYHYGLTIKEHREAKHWTQSRLANVWPRSNGDIGVSPDYVSLVETGKRQLEDVTVLRQICDILDIPLWKMGLSEYNPFNPEDLPGNGRYLYNETLDAVEVLINNAWNLRRTATFPVVVHNIRTLDSIFERMNIYTSRPSRLEFRYSQLQAQVLNLRGMAYVEAKNERMANKMFTTMHDVAKEIDDPVSLARSCIGIGMSHVRQNNCVEAVKELEKARDYSFETSKQLMGLTLSFLARAYAKNGDRYHFEQSIETALRIADRLGNQYGDGTDFSVHSVSDILEEKSNGYIELGLGKETLEIREDIEKRIKQDNNNYLHAWIPLDYAQAYMILGEPEASIDALNTFYVRMRDMLQSPLGISKSVVHIKQMRERGYGNIQVVSDFGESLHV